MISRIALVSLAELASTGCAVEAVGTKTTWAGVAELAVYMTGIVAILWVSKP